MIEQAKAAIKVRIIGSPVGATTGLSRYALNLKQALANFELKITTESLELPRFPAFIYKFALKAGFDLKTFFTTYPLNWVSAPEFATITHLTSQNQASAVAFRQPKHLVITVHDLITLACRQQPEITGYLKFYDKFFDNLAARGLKKADMLITDSEQTKKDIIKHLGYPAERIKVIYLGIDHQTFKPLVVSEDFYNKYNLNKETAYILYVGSEDPRKNLGRLLEAFAQLTNKLPNVQLLKVGSARFPQERLKLLTLASSLNIADKVRFFEQVSDTDLALFYNVAGVLVFPSLYEGFGWPPLEALACGTPVVASNTASLPEIVGEAGLCVNPYDVTALSNALERVLTDQTLSASLRRMGLTQAAKFSWERTACETLSVYKAVLNYIHDFSS